jgi:hypothetical protein
MSCGELKEVGGVTMLVLPSEVVAHLKAAKGDTVFFTHLPDGGLRITPYDPDFEQQIRAGREIMKRDRDVLRALAK